MSAITAKASRKMKKYAVLTREPRCFLGSFNFSWEQRKVSDLAEKTYGGGTPTTSNEAYWNGDIPWIQSSDVVDGKLLGVEPRKWITQDGLNNSAAQLIPGNSIAIITRVGVGKLAFMPYSYATSQDFLSLSKLNAEPLFTVYACYKKLQSELNAVQGTSIKGITKDELLAKNIMVPRYAEQQQIGAFFKQLDNLITLHQRKCANLCSPSQVVFSLLFVTSTFSWEQRKFSELVQIERGGSPRPIDDFITDAPNGLNWVKIGDAPTQGNYITKTAEKIRPEGLSKTREVHPGDLILSNSMSFGKPYIMGIDGCIHDGWLLIRNTYGVFDLTFLCHLLGTPQMLSQYRSLAAGSTVNNLNKELVGNTVVTIPSITEQRVLGDYLEQLDNLITLHQRECISFTGRADRLILTANKKRTTSSWEQRKLGDIGETYTGLSGKTKADFGHGQARFVTYMNVFSNPISNPEMTEPIEIDPKQNEVEVEDVLFTTSSETPEEVGMSSVLLEKRGKTYLNSFCFGFRPSEKIDSYYLAYMLRSESAREKIILLAQGISRYNISKNKVMEIAVSLPSLDEQKLIGQCFRQLDHLITLHQRKFEKLTNVKKSMLEKMFPQNGSSYPEIRFKGFTDPWEQRKFEEIAVRSSVICSDDTLPRVEYEDIVSGAGRLNKDIYAKQSSKSGIAFHQGDVLYGKLRPYLQNWLLPTFDGLAVGDFWVLQPQNADSSFLYRLIQSRQFDEVANQSTGTKMPRADWKLVSKTVFSIPSNISEQAAIGTYFTALDSLITLHQRELEKLQNIKKSMLEKMFV